ncbi:hypothetical protein [Xanthobacter autotrophicus]|uniref:hypothetical protein n=1 Tax=Xanthobacter autotrophicus TaxID=280 RepID=UPI00372CD16B
MSLSSIIGQGGAVRRRRAADFGQDVEGLERHFADMGRKAFATMRGLECERILAVFAERAEREAEAFLGFGHSAEDAEQRHLKGEDLALHLDFEVLKRFTGLHAMSLSDLEGASPEDWFVKRFAARWLADFAPTPSEDAA